MTPISDKIAALIQQYDELEKLNLELNKQHSDIDLELSAWYHLIEGSELNHIAKSHKLLKQGKDILERRRIIKLDCIIVRATCDTLREKMETLKTGYNKNIKKHVELTKEIKERAK